jgi:hypothetical protein
VAPHDPKWLRAAIDQTMVDALAISHLDIYPQLATTKGLVPPETFAPVAIQAAGPTRAHRTFQAP